jgi:hypothetical protein
VSRRWLVAGLAVAVPLTLAGVLTLVAWVFRSSTAGAAAIDDVPGAIVVDVDGDVTVAAVEGAGTVSLRWDSRYFVDRPDVSWRRDRDTLVVSDGCGGFFWPLTDCTTDIRVEVPVGLDLDVGTSSGDVRIEGPLGAVTAGTSSGDVLVRGAAASVDASTSSGNVTVDTNASRITATTSSGDLAVMASGSPPERIEARASSGDVRVSVPYAAYDVDADADSGDEQVSGIVQDGRAERTIVATTSSGDVSISGR